MAKQAYPVPASNPNAQMSIIFLLLWPVNAIVIALANVLFPEQIVLGTSTVSMAGALVLSSGILAWLATMVLPLFTEVEIRKQMVLSPRHWMAGYLVVNVIGVWVLARFAYAIGMGMASWVYVLGLAIVLDVAQGMTMMAWEQSKKKK